jgi:hypothetical protein
LLSRNILRNNSLQKETETIVLFPYIIYNCHLPLDSKGSKPMLTKAQVFVFKELHIYMCNKIKLISHSQKNSIAENTNA